MMQEAWNRNVRHEATLKNLSPEEVRLLITAVAAYRHNAQYQALHMKLVAQQAIERPDPLSF